MAEIYLRFRVHGHLEELPGEGRPCPICGDQAWGDMVVLCAKVSSNDGESWTMARKDDIACVSCAGDKITRDLDNLDGEIVPEDVQDAINDLLGDV